MRTTWAACLLAVAQLVAAEYIPPGPLYRCPEKPLLLYPCACEQGGDDGVRVRCENTNLASMSVGLSNLASLRLPVEELTLHKCNIGKLYGSILYQLKARVLRIEDTPITSIAAHVFHGVNRTLQELHIVNSRLEEFPSEAFQGTFARNTVLKVLNLSGNKLRKLDSNSFRGMRFIRRLYFSDNLITDVGRGTFGSVTRIGTIDLARNKLRTIDYQMFHQLNFVEVIDVSGNEVTEIQKLAFKDLFLVNINISHNHISKIEPGAFENCANITVLDMSHNRIESIPKTAFDSSTYATELLLSHNLLTDLSQVPLHNMTGLKILNVSHNSIETIPRNTFPKLYELHTIDLSHNKVKDIWNGVFQTLFSLRHLNMTNNSLQAVKGSTFGALHTLLELDLSHNRISDMNKVAMARLSSLRTLYLQNNAISKVFQLPISLSNLHLSHNNLERIEPLTTWPTMNSLLMLDVGYNRLGDSLERGSFANLLTLQKLNLAGNGLTKPPWESLIDMSTLQYLYLQENNITYLSKGAFGTLPVVFELNLAHNNIHNISARAFEGLLQLLTLNLTANNISRIPNGAFQGLVSLRTLDLSHNRLEKLDNKTNSLLEDCLSLEKVNLSHNEISFVTRKTFPSSPWIPYRLRHIDLSYNLMPVLTYDMTVGTARVETLNVSHNMINEIRKHVLGNLTTLRVLDLSHNQLEDLPDKILGPPRNLSELYLAHNKLSHLPTEALLSLRSRIALVDARSNQLQLFQHEMMALVENGTDLVLSGNPLECSCAVRPLKQWLSTQASLESIWTDLTCSSPDYLAGRRLVEVSDERMTCPDNAAASGDPKLAVNPDIKFRDVHKSTDGEISATWFVTTREDVGDFHVMVRDTASQGAQPVYEQDVPYTARSHVVPKLTADRESARLELCVLARDSSGGSRRWRASQCRMLDEGTSSAATAVVCGTVPMLILSVAIILV